MISIALLSSAMASLVWIILMRFLTGVMVWTSIALVHIVFLGCLGYSIYRYHCFRYEYNEDINPSII